MHKYWARKPSNVISSLIEHFTKAGDVVLDPFCGSGVALIEALVSGRRALGVDINPAAIRIVEATLSQADEDAIYESLGIIEAALLPLIDRMTQVRCPSCAHDATLRYRVWSSIATCPSCERHQSLGSPLAPPQRGTARCTHCTTPLPATTVEHDRCFGMVIDCACSRGRKAELHVLEEGADESLPVDEGPMLLPNHRILAHDGMRLGSLYIRENWEFLQQLRDAVEDVPLELRRLFEVAFSATVAQVSRLIPYRSNLTTGGPAWTVPGFWIPKVHLQLNVWRTFEKRLDRVVKALRDVRVHLTKSPSACAPHSVIEGGADWWLGRGSACDLKECGLPDCCVDFIITDPPYGDSIPYLEFSQLWNLWFDPELPSESEIAISDSRVRSKNVAVYSRDLARSFSEMARVLKPEGWLTVFFQNRDMAVWKALGDGAACAGFVLEDVDTLIPAVVPAKSQLSRGGSLVGDVILQFRKSKRSVPKTKSLCWKDVARETAVEIVRSRGGEASFEEIATAVLVALWKRGLHRGDGDIAAVFDTALRPLGKHRYGLLKDRSQ